MTLDLFKQLHSLSPLILKLLHSLCQSSPPFSACTELTLHCYNQMLTLQTSWPLTAKNYLINSLSLLFLV